MGKIKLKRKPGDDEEDERQRSKNKAAISNLCATYSLGFARERKKEEEADDGERNRGEGFSGWRNGYGKKKKKIQK